MERYEIIKQYLDTTITEHLPRYIYLREIVGKPKEDAACISSLNELRESKWYRQLQAEMLEDGSFGKFHTRDSKDKSPRVFKTTEQAVSRMKDIGLPYENELVQKVCNIMRKYVLGEAKWSDRIEKHFGFEIALNSIVGANMAYLGDSTEPTLRYQQLCARYIEEALCGGDEFHRDIWDRQNHENIDFLLAPETIHILWFLYDNPYISKHVLYNFMRHLWNCEAGIYYLYGSQVTECISLEDKRFLGWICALEHFSRVSVFPDLASKETGEHLLTQVLKLINKESEVPKSGPVYGHYHESWRNKELCCCDMVLRIARIIARYYKGE